MNIINRSDQEELENASVHGKNPVSNITDSNQE